jgi:hypothetical protein
MQILQHDFTQTIIAILNKYFPVYGDIILNNSQLLQYINIKTKAANRGSKSRASFANHYAIYVLVEDYLNNKFHIHNGYEDYQGAQYMALLTRQRELPFGSKLQNHALNHHLNEEFKRYFRTSPYLPIIRDSATNRYWINENLLKIQIDDQLINIAESIKEIIDAYIQARMTSFNDFMIYCQKMIAIQEQSPETAIEFIRSLLKPNIDAGKYFLDIDKVQRYPVTFVIKTEQKPEYLLNKIEEQAKVRYKIKAIVSRYMECIEEVINIPELMLRFNQVLEFKRGIQVIEEIVLQNRIEFNMEDEAVNDEE